MKTNRGGFTIIETMIFLAISAGMFMSAILVFGNQQRTTQFQQSSRQFESRVNDIVNDTATGTFPEANDIQCSVVAGSIDFTQTPGSQAGDNRDCLFLGKMVHIDYPASGGSYAETLNIMTVVGINSPSGTSFETSTPRAFYDNNPAFDTNDVYTLEWGSQITKAFVRQGASVHYVQGFGVLYDDFAGSTVGNDFISGTSSTSLYVAKNQSSPTSLDLSRVAYSDFRAAIAVPTVATRITKLANTPVYVCFTDSGDKDAVLVIGSNGGSISAVVEFNENVPGECA